MKVNSMNIVKKSLKDSELLTRFFDKRGETIGIALTLHVKKYSKLKKNIIYYISTKIEKYRWTYKLMILNGTLFTFTTTNANIKKHKAAICKVHGDYTVNGYMACHERLMIAEFCQKAILNLENQYLHYGSLVIEFNYILDMSGNSLCIPQSVIDAANYCEAYTNLYLPSRDIKIQVRDKTLWGHKAVLAAHSKYFAKIFENNQLSLNKVIGIAVNEEPKIFCSVLMYMYNREFFYTDVAYIIEIYRISTILEIDILKNECMAYFETNFTKSNAVEILSEAVSYELTDLKNATVRYMISRGVNLLDISEFLKKLKRVHIMEKYIHGLQCFSRNVSNEIQNNL